MRAGASTSTSTHRNARTPALQVRWTALQPDRAGISDVEPVAAARAVPAEVDERDVPRLEPGGERGEVGVENNADVGPECVGAVDPRRVPDVLVDVNPRRVEVIEVRRL